MCWFLGTPITIPYLFQAILNPWRRDGLLSHRNQIWHILLIDFVHSIIIDGVLPIPKPRVSENSSII